MPPLARAQLARTVPRSRPAWRAWLGLLLVLAPVVGYFQLAATVSVEVPYIDDYDAVVDYLTRTLDEPASLRPAALLLAPQRALHDHAEGRGAAQLRGVTSRSTSAC